jgi:hypothetical protein
MHYLRVGAERRLLPALRPVKSNSAQAQRLVAASQQFYPER